MESASKANFSEFCFLEDGKRVRVVDAIGEDPDLVWDNKWPNETWRNVMYNGAGHYPFAINAYYWFAAWPTLKAKHGEEFLRAFWSEYASEEAYQTRTKILTTGAHRKQDINKIHHLALTLHCIEEGYIGTEHDNTAQADSISKILGQHFKDCLMNCNGNGAAALRSYANLVGNTEKVADALNSIKSVEPEPTRSNLKDRLLKAFCDLLVENKAIATRHQLEKKAGIIRQVESGPASSKNVAAALHSLGLGILIERA